MRRKEVSVDIKQAAPGEGGGSITAYASTFDREPDSYGDVVAKGAFSKSLARHEAEGDPILFLWGHDTQDPFSNIGRVTSAVEDERGLLVTAEFDPDSERAQYVRKLVSEGRVTKLSFAYDVLDEAPVELEGGTKANELRELELYEVSLVAIPANRHAEVVESKRRKYGRRQSKADADTLRAVRAGLQDAIGAIDGLLEGDDADEGAGEEEPNEANSDAKSRDLIAMIESL